MTLVARLGIWPSDPLRQMICPLDNASEIGARHLGETQPLPHIGPNAIQRIKVGQLGNAPVDEVS